MTTITILLFFIIVFILQKHCFIIKINKNFRLERLYLSKKSKIKDKLSFNNSESKLRFNYTSMMSGYDQRFPLQEPYTDLSNYIQNLNKKKLLDDLLNTNISISNKLNLLEKDYVRKNYSPNITAGGLFKDFDFEL